MRDRKREKKREREFLTCTSVVRIMRCPPSSRLNTDCSFHAYSNIQKTYMTLSTTLCFVLQLANTTEYLRQACLLHPPLQKHVLQHTLQYTLQGEFSGCIAHVKQSSKSNGHWTIFTISHRYFFGILSTSIGMGWLRLVDSLKLQVSFAEYRQFYRALLQKRPIVLRSLLIEATPYTMSRRLQIVSLFCRI